MTDSPSPFRLVEEPATDALPFEPDDCRCPTPDDQYLLEIDASTVFLRHVTCGKEIGDWADDARHVHLPPTAVTMKWTVDKDNWTGEVNDAWGDLTVNGLPQDVQDAAVALGRQFDEQAREDS